MKKKGIVIWLILAAATVVVNLIAWNSKAFCDWHVKWMFPAAVNLYGRLMSSFPFSVGEWMIVAGVLLCVAAIPVFLLGILWKKDVIRRFACGYFRFMLWTVLIICIVMTYNCFILYHSSEFDEKYMQDKVSGQYTDEHLAAVRDHMVEQLNELTVQMDRDEKGYLIYEDSITRNAVTAMQELGKEYEQLSGYYPRAKEIHASDFLSQEYMMGYYFPFSLEANYNDVMYIMSKPATMCHELAHTKGFIYEDEANLIGFLACLHSDDIMFQYSGYLSVLTYIDNDFIESIDHNTEIYNSHVKISAQVKKDRVFLTEDAWTEVEKKAVVSTKTVKKASNAFTNTTLILNGVEQGSASYGEVVGLLMDYYMCMDDNRMQTEYLVTTEE